MISVVRMLSVFHFWLKVSPRSFILYFVSRWPPDLPVSVLLEPEVVNSCRRDGSSNEGKMEDEVEGKVERDIRAQLKTLEAGGKRRQG